MTQVSRRFLLANTLGGVAAGTLGMPYIANAQATTATIWINQGFIPAEDEAFRKTAADYEKASGNKLDYNIMPFMAVNQKIISALTVEPRKPVLSATAVSGSSYFNNATRQRSYYLVPIKQAAIPFHIWGSLVEKAGFKLSDAPKTWDAFHDFFKPVQDSLRKQGMRKVYAMGMSLTTVGPNDGNGLFTYFVIANSGQNVVTPDGKLHTDDPQVREAYIKTLTYLTSAYKDGYIPPDVLNWNDSDNNNGFHSKLFVMDLDGTISTELAMINDKQAYFHDSVTMGLPAANDGTPMPAQLGAGGGFIPKAAKNVAVAKDFMKYFMQPEVMNENLKNGLGRWAPVIPSIVKDDPWWLDDSTDPHRAPYIRECVLGQTIPSFNGYNPAWGQVSAEQLWGVAEVDVIKNKMTPTAAIDKAFHRAEEIFAKYTLG
jgi:multiple sugar transport system substrate-binding protein